MHSLSAFTEIFLKNSFFELAMQIKCAITFFFKKK